MNMQLQIHTHRIKKTDELIEHTDRRFRFALSRFADRIKSVTIRLEDLNGPKGGVDMNCRVNIQVLRHNEIALDVRDEGILAAIDRAAARAQRTVRRALDRRLERRSRRDSVRHMDA
jgi:ribosome-associated translation inhibitor RaiA